MLHRISQLGLLVCLAAIVAAAQKDYPPPTPKPAPIAKPDKAVKVEDKAKVRVPEPPRAPRWERLDGVTTEKAIAVESNAAVYLCVSDGDVKINGTEKNELRVFVRNGRKFDLRVLERKREAGPAASVELARATGNVPTVGQFANCLNGESIEIDLPLNGSVGIKGRTAAVSIDSVRKATIDLVSGDLTVRNVFGGLWAKTDQGQLTAEDVGGDIGLETSGGNLLAFNIKSSAPGEALKIRTVNGSISLQNVTHRNIDAAALAEGSVKFVGSFVVGGIYRFRSANGRIGLLLPDGVNCKVAVNYGFGTFDKSYPMKVLTQNNSEGGKSLVAALGTGIGPVVNLSTTKGSIRIVKQGEAELP